MKSILTGILSLFIFIGSISAMDYNYEDAYLNEDMLSMAMNDDDIKKKKKKGKKLAEKGKKKKKGFFSKVFGSK
tara:strand:+ start:334 stop:555 length:222 start_codon:yes stop_codon:yes gene_type:complete